MRNPGYYNPRFGQGETGKVGKDDLSFDGKSWEYRDPANFNAQREAGLVKTMDLTSTTATLTST